VGFEIWASIDTSIYDYLISGIPYATGFCVFMLHRWLRHLSWLPNAQMGTHYIWLLLVVKSVLLLLYLTKVSLEITFFSLKCSCIILCRLLHQVLVLFSLMVPTIRTLIQTRRSKKWFMGLLLLQDNNLLLQDPHLSRVYSLMYCPMEYLDSHHLIWSLLYL